MPGVAGSSPAPATSEHPLELRTPTRTLAFKRAPVPAVLRKTLYSLRPPNTHCQEPLNASRIIKLLSTHGVGVDRNLSAFGLTRTFRAQAGPRRLGATLLML